MASSAFVSPFSVATRSSFAATASVCRPSPARASHFVIRNNNRARSATIFMSGDEDKGDDKAAATDEAEQKKDTATEDEEEDTGVSVWGVTSFAIIFIIFAIGIAATLARDFIPGGVTAPAPIS